MKIKEMIEQRNQLNDKAKAMLEAAELETRSLTNDEDEEFRNLISQVEQLDADIAEAEAKSIEDTKVETIKIEEERGNEMDTKELEIRGLEQYIKKQDGEELRNMTTTSGGDTVIPTHLYDEVIKLLQEVAPIYSRVPKLTPVAGTLELLREKSLGADAGFVGEMTNIGSEDFSFDKVKLENRRAGSSVVLSTNLIQDAGIDIVSYAKDVLYRRLGNALDRTMITGKKASNQFEGLVNAPESCNVTMATASTMTTDDFMNTLNAMHPTLQDGAVWIMHRDTFNKLALLKDSVGNYIITRQLNIVTQKPEYRLFGQLILINDAVDKETEAGKVAAYFVNVERAYAGMIKKGIEFRRINGDTTNALRGSETLMIDMYTDCVIKQPEAIRVLKWA